MADTQEAPQPAGLQPIPALGGSVTEAQEALISLMDPEEENPETEEAQPTEVEESQPEKEDESFEEEFEEEESEEEEDSENADERAPEGEDFYAVTVNGEEQEVTLDELVKGYSRQSDYTRKTQELAEQRKSFEQNQEKVNQEFGNIQAERQQYVEALQNVIQNSSEVFEKFSNVNWENLRETDPIEYVTKREEFREAQEKVQKIQNEQHQAHQKFLEEGNKQRQVFLQKEHSALVEALPDWGDSEKQKTIAKELRSYASSQGFSNEELDSLIDHRSILVLLKASRYDKLKNIDLKSKKIKKKPQLVRSRRSVSRDAQKGSKRAAQMKRLQGTGHINDASALLEDFIDI